MEFKFALKKSSFRFVEFKFPIFENSSLRFVEFKFASRELIKFSFCGIQVWVLWNSNLHGKN